MDLKEEDEGTEKGELLSLFLIPLILQRESFFYDRLLIQEGGGNIIATQMNTFPISPIQKTEKEQRNEEEEEEEELHFPFYHSMFALLASLLSSRWGGGKEQHMSEKGRRGGENMNLPLSGRE